MNISPIILEGGRVRLEPLLEYHHAQLCEIGLDAEDKENTVLLKKVSEAKP